MGKLTAVMAMASIGAALLACTERPPSGVNATTARSMAYEPSGSVVRAPLSPPAGYGSPPPLGDLQPPSPAYGNSLDDGADPQSAARSGWRASPRWSAIEGDGCIVVEEDRQSGREADSETPRMKVKNCSKETAGAPASGEILAPADY